MGHIVEVISERECVKVNEWKREFDRIGEPGCGFSFPCDYTGAVDTKDAHYEAWIKNYEYYDEL